MRAWVGKYLIVVGVIHNLVGLSFTWTVLGEMLREGLFNTVAMQHDRNAAFWFLFAGFALMLIGWLVDLCERELQATPRLFGVALLLLTIGGALVMPVSGFWLLLPPAIGLVVRGRGARN